MMSVETKRQPLLHAIFTKDSFYIEAAAPREEEPEVLEEAFLDPEEAGEEPAQAPAEETAPEKKEWDAASLEWAGKWARDFAEDKYRTLFALGFEERPVGVSPSYLWLYRLSATYLKSLTKHPEIEIARENVQVVPADEEERSLLYSLPFGLGTEFIDRDWLARVYGELTEVFRESIRSYPGTVDMFLTEKSQQLRVPERIFFHLVENEADSPYPFAFLCTYATKLPDGVVRHMPLSYALEEFKGQRDKLLSLLSCLKDACEVCPLIDTFVQSGELFHPLGLTSEEAYSILCKVPAIEESGILCRVPNWWKRHSSSVQMQVSLGQDKPSMLGFDAILAMRPSLTVDGVELTQEDARILLSQTEGLAFLKGKWIEVDHQRLQELLDRMAGYQGEVSLLDALKMQAGLKARQQEEAELDVGPLVTNGEWLGDLMYRLRQPQTVKNRPVPEAVHAKLRPYQQTGYSWLEYMQELGFGACLADDMGLGKTLQVLTFLRKLYEDRPEAKVLLIVPTSLVGNWSREAAKFTPDLPLMILHGGSARLREAMLDEGPSFLNITTYGVVNRMEKLQQIKWDCVILDEAQAIKNPTTQQTRNIKKLQAMQKIAMTGTPIENELANLWSLFDFLNKGLLGTSEEFRKFSRELEIHPEGYQKLKNMVSPFILRRLKTDKSIIADLPEKLEQVDYVAMSKKQVVLYRKTVAELEEILSGLSGMQRRGVVLAFIAKLKQICNHPDQLLGQTAYVPEESGKFILLRDICSTIYEKRERVLIFTQYREIIDYLQRYLESIFGRKGLVLHGGIPAAARARLVEQFNGEEYVPFMILSVRAGGTGLNLTAANHVIHFDRWWNPAVENQATDRAFRIGQEKNVMVHKLVCTGTIEEKIDAMINSKKDLAENVIGGGGENWITEMGDQDLLNLMRLEG